MEPLAYIGAGMCALSMMAAAWGVSQVWTTIISIVGRNPQVKKDVDIYGWAGFALLIAVLGKMRCLLRIFRICPRCVR